VLAKLGRTGALILTRMSAFILLCVGVQIVWNGVRALLKTL
jgi:multiple antibiotic resistance protein